MMNDQLNNIKHNQNILSFDKETIWVMKGAQVTLDVTMGSYDGATNCKLVGTCILATLAMTLTTTQVNTNNLEKLKQTKNTL